MLPYHPMNHIKNEECVQCGEKLNALIHLNEGEHNQRQLMVCFFANCPNYGLLQADFLPKEE
jgi:hypothetical protein